MNIDIQPATIPQWLRLPPRHMLGRVVDRNRVAPNGLDKEEAIQETNLSMLAAHIPIVEYPITVGVPADQYWLIPNHEPWRRRDRYALRRDKFQH